MDSIKGLFIPISIHAPTRGATGCDECQRGNVRDFNPRSYKRSDSNVRYDMTNSELFQSTLLQEERHYPEYLPDDFKEFQSTLLQEERP